MRNLIINRNIIFLEELNCYAFFEMILISFFGFLSVLRLLEVKTKNHIRYASTVKMIIIMEHIFDTKFDLFTTIF